MCPDVGEELVAVGSCLCVFLRVCLMGGRRYQVWYETMDSEHRGSLAILRRPLLLMFELVLTFVSLVNDGLAWRRVTRQQRMTSQAGGALWLIWLLGWPSHTQELI